MTDQTTTPQDDGQAARWARREPLLVLLSRMQRGVLLDAERPLLRAAVETELADGDQAHRQVADYENRTSWETNCGEHARLLDALTAAEVKLTAARTALAELEMCDDTDCALGHHVEKLRTALDRGSEQTPDDRA